LNPEQRRVFQPVNNKKDIPNQFKSYTHHRSLKVRHFEMVEATGFNGMESRSSSTSSSPHKISSKSTKRFKMY
jgi:hypothetical protein